MGSRLRSRMEWHILLLVGLLLLPAADSELLASEESMRLKFELNDESKERPSIYELLQREQFFRERARDWLDPRLIRLSCSTDLQTIWLCMLLCMLDKLGMTWI